MSSAAGADVSATSSTDSAQSAPFPVPIVMPDPNAPPPFLCKTYDMVDDPSIDAVVSWSSGNNSFVIWSPPEFGRDLLPKYFKHNNFSSFVRQLNTYGFRKVHPDRWEFAHEGFLRGQKYLLKTIKRRKASHGPIQQPQIEQHPQAQVPTHNASVEVGKSGLEEDVEMLKGEKNVLMQELVKLRQKQQASDKQLLVAMDRLQVMDQRHQQLMSFLAKAVQSPSFFTQCVQQQAQNSRCINEASKKRRIKQDDDTSTNPGGQLVKYQPFFSEAATSFCNMMMEVDNSSQIEFRNDQDDFALGDASSSTYWQYGGSSKDKAVNYSTPEILASSAQFSTTPASVIPPCGSLVDAADCQSSVAGAGSGLGLMVQYPHVSPLLDERAKVQSKPDLSFLMDMLPESTSENFKNDSIQFDLSINDLDEDLFNIENSLPGHDTTDMSAYVGDVWKILKEELGSAQLNELVNGNELLPMNAESEHQNIDNITDQIGLLSSSAKTSDAVSVLHNEVSVLHNEL